MLWLPFGLFVAGACLLVCLLRVQSPSHNFSLVFFCVSLPWHCTHAKHKAYYMYVFMLPFIFTFFFRCGTHPHGHFHFNVRSFRLLINLLRLLSWCGLLSGVIFCCNQSRACLRRIYTKCFLRVPHAHAQDQDPKQNRNLDGLSDTSNVQRSLEYIYFVRPSCEFLTK